MLQHLIVLPIVLPLLVGAGLLLSRATSPTLRRTVSLVAQALMVAIAIALVEDGNNLMGKTLHVPMEDETIDVEVCDAVFYDQKGERLHG